MVERREKMKTYQETVEYIYKYITDRKKFLSNLELALEGPKYLLHLLGDPQEKFPIIHIAGTSGKGSTAYLTSTLLKSQGFTVGLHVSPHILDIRERFQINNSLISEQEFTKTFQEIIPAIEKSNNSKYGPPSYFTILLAFAFYFFQKKKVAFAVIETGLGGLYDSTNTVTNPDKIAVITKIGLDHQWYLGNSYKKIAFQKAGIIQKGNNVITIDQKKSVIEVIKKRAEEKKAELYVLTHKTNLRNVHIDKFRTTFDFEFKALKLPDIKLSLIGYHQAENAAEALTALYTTSQQYKFGINKHEVYESLQQSRFPGRFEIIQTKSKDLIVDGAHNAQKIKTFITSLIKIFPNTQFDFLISFSSGKDQLTTIRAMITKIIPYAKHIYITEFSLIKQDNNHQAVGFSRVKKVLNKLHFKKFTYVRDANLFISKFSSEKREPLVITGSLYLISSLYRTIKSLKNDPV